MTPKHPLDFQINMAYLDALGARSPEECGAAIERLNSLIEQRSQDAVPSNDDWEAV